MTFESINLAELTQCLFNESGDGLFLVDPDSLRLMEANSKAQVMCQRTRDELLEMSLKDVLVSGDSGSIPDLVESSKEANAIAMSGGHRLSLVFDRANSVSVSMRRFSASESTFVLISIREAGHPQSLKDAGDIELTNGTLRLQRILDDVDAIVWEASLPNLDFSFVSKQAERILGYPVQQWKSEPGFWVNHLHQEDAETCLSECEELAARGIDHEMEYRMVAADGRDVWLQDVVRVVKDREGYPVKLRGVMVDVTQRVVAEMRRAQLNEELRKSERQLAHVARLSTMGEMVAGISHEINQPLSAIANFANAGLQLLEQSESESSTQVGTWMRQIAEQAVRCGDIIRRLRGFVRKNDSGDSMVNVKKSIGESQLIIRDVAREHSIDFLIDVPGDLVVRINDVEFQQVIVNLIRNACDAVAEEGAANATIRIVGQRRGGQIRIAVEDDGPGVDLKHAETLFDAFFTTRSEGLGMGLGISRTILKNHGGDLYWDREYVDGARFVIELPCVFSDEAVESMAAQEPGLEGSDSEGESARASLEQSR